MTELVICPKCGGQNVFIKGAMQGLSEIHEMIVDIYFNCDQGHDFVKSIYDDDNGTLVMETVEEEK
jgi:hypothetical protein